MLAHLTPAQTIHGPCFGGGFLMASHPFGGSGEPSTAVMVEVSQGIVMKRIYVVGVLAAVCFAGWVYQAPISYQATSLMSAAGEYSKAVAEFGAL